MSKTKKNITPSAQKTKHNRYIRTIGVLLVGILIGFFLHELLRLSGHPALNYMHQYRLGGYKFISPLLTVDTPPEELDYIRIHPLKKEIEQKIASFKTSHDIERASVYFRLLGSGKWFVVGENERYEPASLVKIPVMIAALRNEEIDPSFSKKKVQFTGSTVPSGIIAQNFKPSKELEVGHSYSIDDLLFRTIAYSDNNAYLLLLPQLDDSIVTKTCNDLLFPLPNKPGQDIMVSVNDLANSFRILYNASYLGEALSEKALNLLSKTDFKEGINRGVPSNIVIAHKFGERNAIGGINSNSKELHDCGIVYYPQLPYLICIMTEGSSFKDLSDAIGDLSLAVYKGVGKYWGSGEK